MEQFPPSPARNKPAPCRRWPGNFWRCQPTLTSPKWNNGYYKKCLCLNPTPSRSMGGCKTTHQASWSGTAAQGFKLKSHFRHRTPSTAETFLLKSNLETDAQRVKAAWRRTWTQHCTAREREIITVTCFTTSKLHLSCISWRKPWRATLQEKSEHQNGGSIQERDFHLQPEAHKVPLKWTEFQLDGLFRVTLQQRETTESNALQEAHKSWHPLLIWTQQPEGLLRTRETFSSSTSAWQHFSASLVFNGFISFF